jgi:hypothetical protein
MLCGSAGSRFDPHFAAAWLQLNNSIIFFVGFTSTIKHQDKPALTKKL